MEPGSAAIERALFELFINPGPFGSELGPWELLVMIIVTFGILAVIAIVARFLLVRELPW